MPGIVFVPSDKIFELRARIFAEDGSVIPESYGYLPAWESTDQTRLELLGRVGHTALLRARQMSGDPKNVSVTLTVEVVKGVATPATITVTQPSAFSGDRISALPDTIGGPLAVALVSGTGTPLRPTVAFAESAELGSLTAGEIIVFSSHREATIDNTSLGLPGDPPASFAAVGPPLAIQVTVFVPEGIVNDDWTSITTTGVIGVEVADAMRTLSLNRTGLTLSVKWDTYNDYEGMSTLCSATTRPAGVGLKIYYVPGMIEYEPERYATGVSCGAPNYDILISTSHALPSTLMHEIGHALALRHTTSVSGFEIFPDNIMKDTEYDRADARSHISLGQAFRTNWDKESWLFNTASPLRTGSRTCLLEAADNNCPALKRDVR